MQMQTPIKTYKVKQLESGKYSLFDDKGKIIPLLIRKKQVTAFYWLNIHPNGMIWAVHKCQSYLFNHDLTPIKLEIEGKLHLALHALHIYDNGSIIAKYKGKSKWYGFNADLTPIALEIEGEQCFAFDSLYIETIYRTIWVKHKGKYYGFHADLTPIALEIGQEQVTALYWLHIDPINGIIRAQYKHKGKYYGFNADLTPIVLEIGQEQVTAFDSLHIDPMNGRLIAKYKGKWYSLNADGRHIVTPILTSNLF